MTINKINGSNNVSGQYGNDTRYSHIRVCLAIIRVSVVRALCNVRSWAT